MIKDIYLKAAELHGHCCPGLAIGVRAAAEAVELLGVTRRGHHLYCIAESAMCYLDGIQWVFGSTAGNRNLVVRERGKTAFNLYDRASGKSVRLLAKPQPAGLSREEKTDFILTAPFDEVFVKTPVRFIAPPDVHVRHEAVKCPLCGEECAEPFLRVKNGVTICLDCAEKE